MNDPTIGQLRTLSDELLPIAVEIINLFREAGIPLGVVSNGARRSRATQTKLVGTGRSATLNSAHLTGDAVDFDVLGFNRDSLPPIFFQVLGQIGESYGLTWGGRWSRPYDPGHFELPKSLRQLA